MKATELEFLKYLYENLPLDILWDLEQGFKADTGNEIPEGYTPTFEEDATVEGFFNEDYPDDPEDRA